MFSFIKLNILIKEGIKISVLKLLVDTIYNVQKKML